MSEKAKCRAMIFSSGRYFPHACGRNAVHEHEGVMYCKTHHPPTVKAKMDERQKVYRDKSEFEMGRINLLNQAIAVKAEYGLTPRELVEQNKLMKDALESIVDCCTEDCASRDYASRQTEILGIARAALATMEKKQ